MRVLTPLKYIASSRYQAHHHAVVIATKRGC